ncbi:MAG: hypothetical protein M0Z95_20230 [Actinomycetota bacterium]|nr:hypothetical protein [Actinomycetota bacterium]
MPCTCRNSDPDSPLPPGADGCVVSPEAARRELARETEILRHQLTAPALLSTQASLLLLPSASARLLMSLAPGGGTTALVPVEERPEDYVTVNTKKKESLNGYL